MSLQDETEQFWVLARQCRRYNPDALTLNALTYFARTVECPSVQARLDQLWDHLAKTYPSQGGSIR